MPFLPKSNCCPLRAWIRYPRGINPVNETPAFLLPSGAPLTAPTLLSFKDCGHRLDWWTKVTPCIECVMELHNLVSQQT